MFCLPERLLKAREYGHRDTIRRQKKSVLEGRRKTAAIQESKALPETTIYGSDIQHVEEDTEPFENVLTVVGILPHQLGALRSWFIKHGVEPKFDPPIGSGQSVSSVGVRSRGNWAYLIFDEPVTSYEFITPTIQLNDRIILSCFVGYFQRRRCYPVPERAPPEVTEDINKRVFKQLKNCRDNCVSLPMEEKSFGNKIREFIFGTREITREQRTMKMMARDLWEKTGIPYAWDRYVMDPLFK